MADDLLRPGVAAPHCARALLCEIGDKNTMVLLPKNGLKLLLFLNRARPDDGGVDGGYPFHMDDGHVLLFHAVRPPSLPPSAIDCCPPTGDSGGKRCDPGTAPCSSDRFRIDSWSGPPRSVITCEDLPRGVGVKLMLVCVVGDDAMDESGDESPLDFARAMVWGPKVCAILSSARTGVSFFSYCGEGETASPLLPPLAPEAGWAQRNGLGSTESCDPAAETLCGLFDFDNDSDCAEFLSNADTNTGEIGGEICPSPVAPSPGRLEARASKIRPVRPTPCPAIAAVNAAAATFSCVNSGGVLNR